MEPEYFYNGGKERLKAVTALHSETFKTDPVLNYLLHDAPEARRREEHLPRFIAALMRAASLNGVRFDEAWAADVGGGVPAARRQPDAARSRDASPPHCCAVWMPPGRQADNWLTLLPAGLLSTFWVVGLGAVRRALGDYQGPPARAKKRALVHPATGAPLRRYHYLFFISTAVDARGRGLASALIRKFQAEVDAEGPAGLPIWLESTTAKNHVVYLRLGFEDVDSWLLGEGEVNEEGSTKPGGSGVRVWGMIWWPKALKAQVKG